jgi:hypothetical protein
MTTTATLGTTPSDLAHVRGALPAHEGWRVFEERCDDGTAYIALDDPRGLPLIVERTGDGFEVTPSMVHPVTRVAGLAESPLPDRPMTARAAAGTIRRLLWLGRRRSS